MNKSFFPDNNDASVPVFKGTIGSKENEGKYNRRFGPNFNKNHRNDGPVFHRTNDEHFRNGNEWSNVIPLTGVWTTERPWHGLNPIVFPAINSNKRYIPYTIGNGWKPCNCDPIPAWRRNDDDFHSESLPGIDDKLEEPFKNRH